MAARGTMPVKGAPPDAAPFRSLALEAAIEKLPGTGNCILDLGPGIAANIEFLLRFSSRVHVADLFDTLETLIADASAVNDEGACCPLPSELLPAPPGRGFDLVLAWTLFDYIPPDELPRLADRLRTIGSPRLLVHALISTQARIPRVPHAFRIEPGGIAMRRRTDEERVGPRQGLTRLMERFPGFRVSRSILLRNGLQEYLLEAS